MLSENSSTHIHSPPQFYYLDIIGNIMTMLLIFLLQCRDRISDDTSSVAARTVGGLMNAYALLSGMPDVPTTFSTSSQQFVRCVRAVHE